MVKEIPHSEVSGLLRRVFGTDEDLYTRRQHSDVKTLDGLVNYAMSNLYDGVMDVDVYSYGDEYGFLAVNGNVCRSFGIKKEHRDKKHLFWDAAKEVIGEDGLFVVWEDNDRAIRFFENKQGELLANQDNMVLYRIKLN